MNIKNVALIVTILLVLGMVSISGCASHETCPKCGSSSLEVVGNYTNHTTSKEMLICNCNNCGNVFEVEK